MSGLEGLLAGRTLAERYRVDELIGRGGFAAVYRAFDERLGRPAAVKVITVAAADAATREQIRRRFEREAHVASNLDHPNVVTVYDVGTDPDLQLDFLVMELLRGEDLAARLARAEPIELAAAVRILRDAARGIAAGHRGGLIHRDVKPANIFLASEEWAQRVRVCVLDFGIAQIRDAEHSLTKLTHGAAPHSPRYASPEQLQEAKELTPASDVFSLGVIGCELLTRERVFTPEQIQAISRGERPDAPALPGAPPALEATLRRAMEWEPEDRFPGAHEMAESLDEVLEALREAPSAPRAERPATPTAPRGPVAPAPGAAPAAGSGEGTRRSRVTRTGALWVGVPVLAVAGVAWWAASGGSGAERTQPRRPAAEVARGPGAEPAYTPDSLTWRSRPGGIPRAPVPGAPRGAAGTPAQAPGAPRGGATPPTGATRSPSGSTLPASAGSGGAGPVAANTGPRAEAPPGAAPAARRPPASAPRPSPPPEPRTARSAGTNTAVEQARAADRSLARGNVSAAVEGYRRAVSTSPRDAFYRNELGWALFRSGDLNGAERELREAIRLDPNRDIAYANLGEVYRVRGDTPQAIEYYRRFLALNTDPRRERIATEKLRGMGAAP